MKIESKTLTLVLPPGGNSDEPCWGMVLKEVSPRLSLVQVPKTKTDKGIDLPTVIPVRTEFLVPLPHGDGFSEKERLKRAVFKYVDRRFPKIAKDFFAIKKLPEQSAALELGTLVIITRGNWFLRRPCWGIITKIMPSHGFDVALGKRRKVFGLVRTRVFAEQNDLVPVAETDGKSALTRKLIFINMDKVIPLLLYWLNGRTGERP